MKGKKTVSGKCAFCVVRTPFQDEQTYITMLPFENMCEVSIRLYLTIIGPSMEYFYFAVLTCHFAEFRACRCNITILYYYEDLFLF